ncbi:hypothetical protein E4U52_006573, partial [Claviceps spartinae]
MSSSSVALKILNVSIPTTTSTNNNKYQQQQVPTTTSTNNNKYQQQQQVLSYRDQASNDRPLKESPAIRNMARSTRKP